MIDVEKLQATLIGQKEKEQQARLAEQAKQQLMSEQKDRNFVESINRYAQNLQADIEKATAKGEHSIWVFTDECINAVMDRFKFDRQSGRQPNVNPFYEQFHSPYGSAKHDNPFHALWEPLQKLGMRWEIDFTPESRDIDYRHGSYSTLILRW